MAGPLAVSRTRVVLMRTTVLLLALLATLTACGDGGGEGGDNAGAGGAESVERTTTERAEEAIPLASEALGATDAEVYTQWQSCMAISSKYAAIGHLVAAEKDTAQQLESVRTALVEVGYDDVTQVEGHVTMERDGTTSTSSSRVRRTARTGGRSRSPRSARATAATTRHRSTATPRSSSRASSAEPARRR